MHPHSTRFFHDKTGERYGRLLVLGPAHTARNAIRYWHVRCDCGREKVVSGSHLNDGGVQSCGCLNRERVRAATGTHGMKHSREYAAWRHMKARCFNARHPFYADYGGRGIVVCARWRDSFEAFFSDMGSVPDGYTLDRIDNDGGYTPENCRWATWKMQARNRRDNTILTWGGRTQTVAAWAEERHIDYETLLGRIQRGWAVEDALTRPVQPRHQRTS